MKSVLSFMHLLWIRTWVSAWNSWEEIRVICKYYCTNFRFCQCDLSLRLRYFLQNPFGISKQFALQRGEEEANIYGETPLTTVEKIVREVGICSNDVVWEVGAGRGRLLFWLHFFVGCRAMGIEQVPFFVQQAREVVRLRQISGVSLYEGDALHCSFAQATVIYLYGTTFADSFLEKLAKRCEELPSGTKIISVSYPLGLYGTGGRFAFVKEFSARFPWGTTEIYVEEIVSKEPIASPRR